MLHKNETSTAPEAAPVIADYLFRSDFYEIKNWAVDFNAAARPAKGYNESLCMVFVRSGNFNFDLSKNSYDMHTGHLIIDKPDYEYRLRPCTGSCSIFNFTDACYREFIDDLNLKYAFFFSNPNLLSLLLKSTPQIDYLHYQVMKKVLHAGKLEMDSMVMELLKQVVGAITDSPVNDELDASLRTHHLFTMERAKEYIHDNFSGNISLQELARHSHVSPFHFSRIFKKFTAFSPHQYLLKIRLKHAEMLLKNTTTSISEISFAAGFNSPEHFATAFRQQYKTNPANYRNS